MKVEVRYFASLVDRTGTRAEPIEVDASDRVGELWERAVRLHPELATLRTRPMAALDRRYAAWDAPLAGVTEVAFLPPVSGG